MRFLLVALALCAGLCAADRPVLVLSGTGQYQPLATGDAYLTKAGSYFTAGPIVHRQASTQDGMAIQGRAGGTGSWSVTHIPTTLSASRTVTWPDADGIPAISAAALTSGRVPYVTTGGLLLDSAGIRYDQSASDQNLYVGDGATGSAVVYIQGATASGKDIYFSSGGTALTDQRWTLRSAATTDDFSIIARDGSGAIIDAPLSVVRTAGGTLTITRPVAITSIATTLGANAGASQTLTLNAAAATNKDVNMQSGGVGRWTIRSANTAESGSDAGSPFQILARTDAGAAIDTPLAIVRASGGAITFGRPTTQATNWTQTGATTLNTGTGVGTYNHTTEQHLGTVLVSSSATAQAFTVSSGTATTPNLQVNGNNSTTSTGTFTRWANNPSGGGIILAKSRGAVGTYTVVQQNDSLGVITANGSDGTAMREAAVISFAVDGSSISSTSMPGRIDFNVTISGAVGPTLAMRISNDKTVSLLSTADATSTTTGSLTTLGGISAGKDIYALAYNAVGGTVTTSNPPFQATQTWNAGGVTFSAIDLDITNTASAAASRLINLKVGGSGRFQIDPAPAAGETAMYLYDADNATLERVTVGAADSGGAGFKVLRIPN
jgi:hypothetical protein